MGRFCPDDADAVIDKLSAFQKGDAYILCSWVNGQDFCVVFEYSFLMIYGVLGQLMPVQSVKA